MEGKRRCQGGNYLNRYLRRYPSIPAERRAAANATGPGRRVVLDMA